ncbi:copper-binding protein [Pelomonas sp. APW6]|uniref:Copper-binding protein n=1 Tax=Roseateles subflavus TaxID=3053353 RepID=A0ABT7LP76_9BURK|nr:copper-binding protein [Pelomonas sp. APW6]MDL5034681.1 copper-binding protein [Pelomonas sp. APW6]
MQTFKTAASLAALTLGALAGAAQGQAKMPAQTPGAGASSPVPAVELTEGEIRKIDKDQRKLTLRHGEIKHLQMPGMTMVFQVRDPAMLEQVKVGDKVRFRVERGPTGLVVTDLQPAGG